jgi:hypothetical protein
MTKNAIIFDAWMLNGSLLDCLEYYLYARSIGKEVTLILLEHSCFDVRKAIKDIVSDRYLAPDNWERGIVVWDTKTKLLTTEFDNIVVMDYTTLEHVPIMRGAKIHIIYDHQPSKAKLYRLLDAHDHVELYNEMPFGIGKHYLSKFAFTLYRKVGYTTGIFIDRKAGRHVKGHQKGLFDSFYTYRYVHDGTFDRRPRMMVEACFYKKKMEYVNPNEVKDGSWYRWKDLQENGIEHRSLTKNDEIMRIL